MGWENLPISAFYRSWNSANNPFGSSLDCGACAASPGRHNARMLKIANIPEVRQALKENHNIEIPASTIFIGGEHNTTTDEILLFDSEVPDSHKNNCKVEIKFAKNTANGNSRKAGCCYNSVALANKNRITGARPEWGLAKKCRIYCRFERIN
jgi:uncharacterized protein YbcC (UPF0753/DUF2309 family)